MSDNEQRITLAINYMKAARTFLKKANCPKTLERLRLTLTSAQGALRNANHHAGAERRGETRKRIKRAPRMRVSCDSSGRQCAPGGPGVKTFGVP